ncbi:MAG: hypothetical protein HOO96_40590 [Polyangiaceae bacterium]|nr:hypothetical protein [Polyangiaceae bacterium]
MVDEDPFSELYNAGWLLAHERQIAFGERIGDASWEMDVEKGILVFGGRLQTRAGVFATWARGDSSLLWGWANEGLPASARGPALALRDYGEKSGIRVLEQRKWQLDEEDAFGVCLAAAGMLDEIMSLYRAPHEGGFAYLAIVDENLRLGPPEAARIARVVLEGVAQGLIGPAIAVPKYLKARGFNVVRSDDAFVRASHRELPLIEINFDEQSPVTVQIGGRRFDPDSHEVDETDVGRSPAGAVVRLLLDNVPELARAPLEVVALSRDPGRCTLVAVASTIPSVDATDALAELEATGMATVCEYLPNEEVSLIPWGSDFLQRVVASFDGGVVNLVCDDESQEVVVVIEDESYDQVVGERLLAVAGLFPEWTFFAARASGFSPDAPDDVSRSSAAQATNRRLLRWERGA